MLARGLVWPARGKVGGAAAPVPNISKHFRTFLQEPPPKGRVHPRFRTFSEHFRVASPPGGRLGERPHQFRTFSEHFRTFPNNCGGGGLPPRGRGTHQEGGRAGGRAPPRESLKVTVVSRAVGRVRFPRYRRIECRRCTCAAVVATARGESSPCEKGWCKAQGWRVKLTSPGTTWVAYGRFRSRLPSLAESFFLGGGAASRFDIALIYQTLGPEAGGRSRGKSTRDVVRLSRRSAGVGNMPTCRRAPSNPER